MLPPHPLRSVQFPRVAQDMLPPLALAATLVGMPYMYILECGDRSLYVRSALDLQRRLDQLQAGEGALYTRSRLPVRLLYSEEFLRVDDAYRREKQVQGWGRAKRLALAKGRSDLLAPLARKEWADASERE